MFKVTVDNTQFETWASTTLPQNIMQIMNWIAYQTELHLESETSKFKQPTGKTQAALAKMQQAERHGNTFESGVGDTRMVGVASTTAAPPNTIRDFKTWLSSQLQ